MAVDDYNYPRFDEYVRAGGEAQEFASFPAHLHAGEPAPDAIVTRLDDGERVALSSLWRARLAVIEFGSFT